MGLEREPSVGAADITDCGADGQAERLERLSKVHADLRAAAVKGVCRGGGRAVGPGEGGHWRAAARAPASLQEAP